MKSSVAVLALLAIGFAPHAHGYEWVGSKHGCVVERSTFANLKEPSTGNWSNAPSSFFVNVWTCEGFAEEFGLSPGVEPSLEDVGNGLDAQMWLNECYEISRSGGLIAKSERLDEGTGYFLPSFSFGIDALVPFVTRLGGVLRLHKDGTADYSIGSWDNGGTEPSNATWFMLTASCTPM